MTGVTKEQAFHMIKDLVTSDVDVSDLLPPDGMSEDMKAFSAALEKAYTENPHLRPDNSLSERLRAMVADARKLTP